MILNVSLPLIKCIIEIISLYKKFVYKASCKRWIMAILLDKEFLKGNLLHPGMNDDEGREKRIMKIFRELKHLDVLHTEIKISQVDGSILTSDTSNKIDLNLVNFFFKHKEEKGIEELHMKFNYANL